MEKMMFLQMRLRKCWYVQYVDSMWRDTVERHEEGVRSAAFWGEMKEKSFFYLTVMWKWFFLPLWTWKIIDRVIWEMANNTGNYLCTVRLGQGRTQQTCLLSLDLTLVFYYLSLKWCHGGQIMSPYVLFPVEADHKWQAIKKASTGMCCVKLHRMLSFIWKENKCFDMKLKTSNKSLRGSVCYVSVFY